MLLVKAAGWTLIISVTSIVIGLVLGTCVSAAMLSSRRWLSIPGRLFVSFFRGAPLLVQLILIYNLLPAMGLNVPSVVAAIAALSLCTAAYQAENLRGGFASVPKGYLEAAEMLGMSHFTQFLRIRAPIALRAMQPAIANEAIMILKASSLVSVVGVVELTRMAQDLSASTFLPLHLFATAGVLYLLINTVIALGSRSLESRMNWGKKA